MRKYLNLIYMPLLWKELIELSARKRTYMLRVIYCLFTYLIFYLSSAHYFKRAVENPYLLLGGGLDIFNLFIGIQFFGIYMLLPGMMSGVITLEKERNSLPLLFLTPLKPWSIILQKYMSRLIPMFSFIIMGFPILAVAYSLGGIPTSYIYNASYLLFITCLQVGAFALMISSHSGTSLQSFLRSYLLAILLFVLLALLSGLLPWIFKIPSALFDEFALGLFVPYLMVYGLDKPFTDILMQSKYALLSTVVFLILARYFFLRRAFLASGNSLLGFFQRLDKAMTFLNRIVGNIELIKSRKPELRYKPIFWREVTKKSLGNFRYLFRVLVVLLIPTLLASLLSIATGGEGHAVFVAGIWAIVILCISAKAASLFPAERSNQTLEVLLTTTLSGRDIVLQMMSSMKRIFLVLSIPLIILIIIKIFFGGNQSSYRYSIRTFSWMEYLLFSAASILIYFNLLSWFSLWVSIKAKTRFRAIMTSLFFILIIIFGPLLTVAFFAEIFNVHNEEVLATACLLSPATFPALTEVNELDELLFSPFIAALVNYTFYGFIAYLIRKRCLKNADRFLGRN